MHTHLQLVARHFLPAPAASTPRTKRETLDPRVVERANELLAKEKLNEADAIGEALSECSDYTHVAALLAAGRFAAVGQWVSQTVRAYWLDYYLKLAQTEIENADAGACKRCRDAGCSSCEANH